MAEHPTELKPASRRWRRASLPAVAALLTGLLLAACTGPTKGSPSKASTASSAPGAPARGGTVTFALPPASTPNYIFPLAAGPYFTVANLSQFQALMFRPLYWFGEDGKPVLNTSLSLAHPPAYSDGGRVVTITLKPYRWSDGAPVTSRDVLFWMNLLKANRDQWAGYVPGDFPDNVTSMSAPNASTVIFHLNTRYSSRWFTYNELSQITPLPQQAWDKTSAKAADGNYDETPAGARAVYRFLNAQAERLSTYATNPLWQVVDGPWRLAAFTTTGQATFVPNRRYSGPDKPRIARFIELPFTTETAEYDALRAGRLTIGYLPPPDVAQKGLLAQQGYHLYPWVIFGFSFMRINFHNPTVGAIFHQLYIRQALQHLIDQRSYIEHLYHGYAVPTYGPVPVQPPNPYVSPAERHNPYPYSIQEAKKLLTSHGWSVTPGRAATCVSPGSGSGHCGAGVVRGASLVLHLQFASGNPPLQQEVEALKSSAGQAGIVIELSSAPADTVIANQAVCKPSQPSCSWEIQNYGAGWVYSPDYLPTGGDLYATGAGANKGSYASKTADKLIAATHTSSKLSALYAYENYISRQLPALWQPQADYQVTAVRTNLEGVVPQNPYAFIEPARWYFTK
jgi:peptide/nickel transport system substrate-binding protein